MRRALPQYRTCIASTVAALLLAVPIEDARAEDRPASRDAWLVSEAGTRAVIMLGPSRALLPAGSDDEVLGASRLLLCIDRCLAVVGQERTPQGVVVTVPEPLWAGRLRAMSRPVRIGAALGLVVGVASGCRHPTPAGDPPAMARPTRAAPARPGEGVLHDDGTTFAAPRERDPACGTAACGNGRLDSCTVRPPAAPGTAPRWLAETCDGSAPPVTCAELGYFAGDLGCTEACAWDVSRCEVCPPGQCTVRPTRITEGPIVALGLAAATDGARVRVVWSVAESIDGRSTACLYAGWADTAEVQRVDCGTLPQQRVALTLQASDQDTFELGVEYGAKAWRGRLDATGHLTAGLAEEPVPAPDPDGWRCDTLEVRGDPDGLRLQLHDDDTTEGEVPMMAQWLRAGQPVDSPFALLTAPYVHPCIAGAVVGEQLTAALYVPTRGLVTTTIPLPR